MLLLFFFFFQAEDGIRDLYVTGVQTCALPILRVTGGCNRSCCAMVQKPWILIHWASIDCRCNATQSSAGLSVPSSRSEERRVGKECRYRWSRYQYKKRKEKEGVAVILCVQNSR